MIESLTLNNVQLIWVLIFILILYDSKRRLDKIVKKEWSYNFGSQHGFRPPTYSTLAKMYSSMKTRSKKELAELVTVEMCKDAGIYFNTSLFYFLHLRQDPSELSKYFSNKELVSFLFKSEIWVNAYIKRNYGGFNRRNKQELDRAFIAEMSRLLDIFKLELVNKRYE